VHLFSYEIPEFHTKRAALTHSQSCPFASKLPFSFNHKSGALVHKKGLKPL